VRALISNSVPESAANRGPGSTISPEPIDISVVALKNLRLLKMVLASVEFIAGAVIALNPIAVRAAVLESVFPGCLLLRRNGSISIT